MGKLIYSHTDGFFSRPVHVGAIRTWKACAKPRRPFSDSVSWKTLFLCNVCQTMARRGNERNLPTRDNYFSLDTTVPAIVWASPSCGYLVGTFLGYDDHSFVYLQLAPIKLSRYGEDLLFYLYYTNGGDILQLAAAAELWVLKSYLHWIFAFDLTQGFNAALSHLS